MSLLTGNEAVVSCVGLINGKPVCRGLFAKYALSLFLKIFSCAILYNPRFSGYPKKREVKMRVYLRNHSREYSDLQWWSREKLL